MAATEILNLVNNLTEWPKMNDISAKIHDILDWDHFTMIWENIWATWNSKWPPFFKMAATEMLILVQNVTEWDKMIDVSAKVLKILDLDHLTMLWEKKLATWNSKWPPFFKMAAQWNTDFGTKCNWMTKNKWYKCQSTQDIGLARTWMI